MRNPVRFHADKLATLALSAKPFNSERRQFEQSATATYCNNSRSGVIRFRHSEALWSIISPAPRYSVNRLSIN